MAIVRSAGIVVAAIYGRKNTARGYVAAIGGTHAAVIARNG